MTVVTRCAPSQTGEPAPGTVPAPLESSLASGAPCTPPPTYVLRLATAADADTLRRLADLDSQRAARGRDPHRRAARRARSPPLSLTDDRAIADPFQPTAHLLATMRVRARRPARRRGDAVAARAPASPGCRSRTARAARAAARRAPTLRRRDGSRSLRILAAGSGAPRDLPRAARWSIHERASGPAHRGRPRRPELPREEAEALLLAVDALRPLLERVRAEIAPEPEPEPASAPIARSRSPTTTTRCAAPPGWRASRCARRAPRSTSAVRPPSSGGPGRRRRAATSHPPRTRPSSRRRAQWQRLTAVYPRRHRRRPRRHHPRPADGPPHVGRRRLLAASRIATATASPGCSSGAGTASSRSTRRRRRGDPRRALRGRADRPAGRRARGRRRHLPPRRRRRRARRRGDRDRRAGGLDAARRRRRGGRRPRPRGAGLEVVMDRCPAIEIRRLGLG